jgi:hypothetical protein
MNSRWPQGVLVPAKVLDVVFDQKPEESGILANMIERQDTKEKGLLLVTNAAGAEEIIDALSKAGMTSTVSALRQALAQRPAGPGAPMRVRNAEILQ